MSESGVRREPEIDLETVRETLEYIRGDVAGVPRLAAVGRALDKVLEEIEAADEAVGAEVRAVSIEAEPSRVVAFRPAQVRFVRWQPKG